jgi:hypothetical protein
MNGTYKMVYWRRKQPLERYTEEISPQKISHNMVNMVAWAYTSSLIHSSSKRSNGSTDEARHPDQHIQNPAKYFQQQGLNGSTRNQQLRPNPVPFFLAFMHDYKDSSEFICSLTICL